jgi:hypothetical protein
MKQNPLFSILCSLSILMLLFPQNVNAAEKTPQEFLKEFYTWYITTAEGTSRALDDERIYDYVTHDTVERAKNGDSRDQRDYFLKMYDFPLNMSNVDIVVGDVTDMSGDTTVAPVTITSDLFRYRTVNHIVVVLKKINNDIKITHCIDTYPES